MKDEVKEVRRQQKENLRMKKQFSKGPRGAGGPGAGTRPPGGAGQPKGGQYRGGQQQKK